MAPYSVCRRIVRTIHGQSTGGDDDRYVCDDGSVWKRRDSWGANATAPGSTAWLRGNHVCDHKGESHD